MIHAGVKMYATIGPSRMALDGSGGMWLLSHGRLHHFGDDGLRREVADLASIGAPPRPSDFDLHRDGRAVIADPDTSELVRCKLPSGPCERLPARIKTLPGQELLPLNAAKVHVDDEGGRYFVSDNAGHQVVVMDFDGNVKARTRPGQLRHPNQLALRAPDRLAVVDTDHHRIAFLDPGLQTAAASMSTFAEGVARPLREWPFDAVPLPTGETAVLIAAHAMRDADLVFFDASGTPVRRAELGRDSDPFDVELWRGQLWVSDATRYRVDRVNLDGSRGGTLEDPAFLAELAEAREEPAKWRSIRRAAQLGLVGIPLLGALLLWRLGKPAARVPAPQPAPAAALLDSPPNAFGVRTVLLRRLRIATTVVAWLILLLCVGTVALMAYLYPIMFFAIRDHAPLFLRLGAILVAGFLLFFTYRALPNAYTRMRLAFDAGGVRYELASMRSPFGKGIQRGQAPWSAVYADDMRLLVGPRLFTLRIPGIGALYEEEGVAALLEHLPEGHKVARAQLSRLAWRAGALRTPVIVTLLLLVIAALTLVAARALL